MIAIIPKGRREWCSEDDLKLPEEQRTYWLIEDLDEMGRVALNDAAPVGFDDDGKRRHGTGTRIHLTLKHGLKGIKEGSAFCGADGTPVPFEVGKDGLVTNEFLGMIGDADQLKIFMEIMQATSLEEEEKEG